LVVDNVVVQTQPRPESGFIQAPVNTRCGYVYTGGKFSIQTNCATNIKPDTVNIADRLADLEREIAVLKTNAVKSANTNATRSLH